MAVVAFLLIIALAAAFMLIPAALIWWLYNSFLAPELGWQSVSFWVVYAAFIIFRLVFGSTGSSSK